MRMIHTILLYVLTMALLFITRPRFLFEEDGSLKTFGLDEGQTILSMGFVSVVVAISCFFLFTCVDLVCD
jgi:hypothetical protein